MWLHLLKIVLTIPVAYAFVYPLLTPAAGAGVFRDLALVGPAAATGIALAFLLAVFLYCRDLERALTLVQPEARTATPRSVWLMFLIPYNFVEDFFIIANVANSLRREALQNKALRPVQSFGLISGLAWCSLQIVSLIPHEIGSLAGFLALPFWVVHWRLIRKVNAVLTTQQRI